MEIDNILDALALNDVAEIIQLCTCTYNETTVEFRLINDDVGIIDEIEFKKDDDTWVLDYGDCDDEDISMIVDAILNAPFEVFHKSDVGATLNLNHESIKPQNLPEHFKTKFYVDDQDGPIVFKLEKNIVKLN